MLIMKSQVAAVRYKIPFLFKIFRLINMRYLMIHVDEERMSDKICIIRYLGTKGIRYVSCTGY